MVPFQFTEEWIDTISAQLPELPDARKARFVDEYGLPPHDATVLTESSSDAAWFERAVAVSDEGSAPELAKLALSEVASHANDLGVSVSATPMTPQRLASTLKYITVGDISRNQAKQVIADVVESDVDPGEAIGRLGMQQVSDAGEIEEVVDRVMAANPGQVEQYRAGKTGLMGFFVGQVMRETGGQANPAVVNEVVKRKLG